MNKDTQQNRILRALENHRMTGVANYKFPAMGILCYTKRISELRKDGYNILSERQVLNGKYTGTWIYHLVAEEKPKSHWWSKRAVV